MRILFALLLFLLIFPCQISAHTNSQQSYFKVNGAFTNFYPVPSSSLADFKLPQDIAVGMFLVNEPIEFEIDVNALPVPYEVVEKTTFVWEFGDGTKTQGLKNSHTYTKQGTYFLDVYADSGQGFEPILLQSTAINILPGKDYKLPVSVIEINGEQAKDPLLDIVDVNFKEEIKFDGSKSDKGSSQITEYIWDLGDMNSKTEAGFEYKYSENPYTVFPVLRVKTSDGFIADSFTQIKDENAFSGGKNLLSGLRTERGINWSLMIGGVLISLILAVILAWVISKFVLKK